VRALGRRRGTAHRPFIVVFFIKPSSTIVAKYSTPHDHSKKKKRKKKKKKKKKKKGDSNDRKLSLFVLTYAAV